MKGTFADRRNKHLFCFGRCACHLPGGMRRCPRANGKSLAESTNDIENRPEVLDFLCVGCPLPSCP
eukprot:2722534-Amphidinium_carterae.1